MNKPVDNFIYRIVAKSQSAASILRLKGKRQYKETIQYNTIQYIRDSFGCIDAMTANKMH